MFEEQIKAIEEIEELKGKYKLCAEKVFILRILKLAEIDKMSYDKMKDYFIENCRNCENKVTKKEQINT